MRALATEKEEMKQLSHPLLEIHLFWVTTSKETIILNREKRHQS